MIIVDTHLEKRHKNNQPIQVGIIGAGAMSRGLINQITNHTKGMRVAACFNRTPDRLVKIFQEVGIENYKVVDDQTSFDADVGGDLCLIASDLELLINNDDLDVLVDMTGAIEFSADLALKAFAKGRDLISFNAELDATIGPVLQRLAREAGSKYCIADGDQPGVTMNLYRYVKGMGFDPVLCGNIKGLEDHYRNPTTQKSFAATWDQSTGMVTSFADGTKMAIEQACIANATGMKVAKRGMYGHYTDKHIDDVKHLWDLEEMQALGGIVDYVVGGKPGPGVFVYATAKDEISKKYLKYGKLGDGPLYSFYVPYHLLFFDIPSSIARMVDLDDMTIVSGDKPVVEVVALAKIDLKEGDFLDGLGGYTHYGVAENSEIARQEQLLPVALAEGCRLKRNLNRDTPITFADLEFPQERLVDRLWKQQFDLH